MKNLKDLIKKIKILINLYEFACKEVPFIKKILIKLNLEVSESKKIVSAFLMGGLGNQLFQIANVFAYAWEHSFIPLFKKSKNTPGLVVRPSYWDTVFHNINITKRLPLKLLTYREKSFVYNQISNPDKILNLKKKNGINFYGYFQSAKYFDKYRKKLFPFIFHIKPNEKDYLRLKYPEIFDGKKILIAVHIRRGDNVNHPIPNVFPNLWTFDYYEKSLNYIKNKFDIKEIKIVIFSDDPSWSRMYIMQKFPELDVLCPSEKDYLDLYLMSCCKHQIIANSSFSWWAAYMNNNPEKIIIAPKNWFGSKGPPKWETLYMDNWIKM